MISAPSSILEQCLYSSADFEGTSFHSSDTEFDDIFIDPNWTKQDDTILIAEKVTGETIKGPSKECNVLPRNTNKGRILNLFKIRSKLNPFQFATLLYKYPDMGYIEIINPGSIVVCIPRGKMPNS